MKYSMPIFIRKNVELVKYLTNNTLELRYIRIYIIILLFIPLLYRIYIRSTKSLNIWYK